MSADEQSVRVLVVIDLLLVDDTKANRYDQVLIARNWFWAFE